MITFLAVALAACPAEAPEAALASMMQADRDFAALAAEVGVAEAFAEYAAHDARLIASGTEPVGPEDIAASRAGLEGASLRWAPRGGYVDENGSFGSTFGSWALYPEAGGALSATGDYITVWRKDADCTWRYVLDGGSVDPEPVLDPVLTQE
ncbi:hypothetical protein E5163_10620 [Marinicauda algicola]|uniref:Nuclear transport factor 2 family protein n=1 Tax=Marinicauda algicola TaxID=2029849 RepID=A0A4S2GZA2_9PROT|nr:hypothetical protein [Marinicauda algicola]TGY88271.1 hypothetical protein E5163_10620 [Marinicauda algicola]